MTKMFTSLALGAAFAAGVLAGSSAFLPVSADPAGAVRIVTPGNAGNAGHAANAGLAAANGGAGQAAERKDKIDLSVCELATFDFDKCLN